MTLNTMKVVLSLTKAGRLQEATQCIQRALSGTVPLTSAAGEAHIEKSHARRPLRPLSEAVAKLGKLVQKPTRITLATKLDIPAGAKFQDGSFTCAAGTRTYKLYVPKSLPLHGGGLIVMLHGCTQNAVDFAAGTGMNEIAEAEGMIVVYLNQAMQANSSGCWNWFNPRDQIHGQGEPSIIAGITEELISAYHVKPNQVFIAGLSSGGAMAVILGHTYPTLYSAIGVHSGLPYRSANDVISAFSAMRGERKSSSILLKPRVIVFHGDADTTVHPSNALAIVSSVKDHSVKTATVFPPVEENTPGQS